MTGLTAGQKINLPVPEKEGHMFIGWYESEDLTGTAYNKYNQRILERIRFYGSYFCTCH